MSQHFHKQVERLKKKLLTLSAVVEENLHRAVHSVEFRDVELANNVIQGDREIDDMEVEVEEECLKILALYQPVAADLRFIVAVLKMNNDLERIGDLAVNIAERSLILSKLDKPQQPFDFTDMAERVQGMLKKSLDALVNLDDTLAKDVIKSDDEVDRQHRECYDRVKSGLKDDLNNMDSLLYYLSISRHLERIADHATNIAEDILYMVRGDIVRHKSFSRENRTPTHV